MFREIWYWAGCAALAFLAVLDGLGIQSHLQKRYRGLKATALWQKRQAALEGTTAFAAALFFLLPWGRAGTLLTGGLIIALFILMGLNGRAHVKAAQKEEAEQKGEAALPAPGEKRP